MAADRTSEDGLATAPHTPEADDELRSGARIGRFVVEGAIGAGGMGRVVAAYDPVLDRRIALKLLRAGDTAGDARLLREAQAMARLAHPNVVAVHEAGAADGRVYLAMELVDGGTLRGWLAAPRGWRDIRDRFVEAGRGLAAAHDAGMVHRDFKPDNVLVGRDGRARVTDFGLVRAAPTDAPVAPAPGVTSAVAGTPRYMAPEQHRGQPADARADQFAFCVALYEALWRADPFAAADAEARRARVLAGDASPPPPSRVPARLAATVLRGLAADPAARHPSMQAVLEQLVRLPSRRRRARVVASALAAGALAVVAATTAWLVARPAAAPAASAPPDAPDPHRFQLGLAMTWPPGDPGPQLDRLVRAGATATTLPIAWQALEPVRGARDWSALDQRIAAIEQRGLEPFAEIVGTPAWLDREAPACGAAIEPPPTRANLAAFRDFHRALARRYCDRVKYYEFWREPDGCAWRRCGCPPADADRAQAYALWLDQWYQAMREGCADLVLAVGGLDCGDGAACASYVDALYDNGAADSFDAVAVHARGATWAGPDEIAAALARHGNATRQIWVSAWSAPPAALAAALAALRTRPAIVAAHHLAITDEPALRTFRELALGPGAIWHGPSNPGLEFQGQPPTPQFTTPMPSWGPNGAWQLHRLVPRTGNATLGRKFGYYSAGLREHFAQTLGDRFAPDRRYCFRSTAAAGRRKTGVLPYQLGYLDATGFVALATRAIPVDARWRDTAGVCHDTGAGPEVGQPITIRFGAGADGGVNDIWFDNLRVTSTPRRASAAPR
jgi:hypothetical protein